MIGGEADMAFSMPAGWCFDFGDVGPLLVDGGVRLVDRRLRSPLRCVEVLQLCERRLELWSSVSSLAKDDCALWMAERWSRAWSRSDFCWEIWSLVCWMASDEAPRVRSVASRDSRIRSWAVPSLILPSVSLAVASLSASSSFAD